MGDEIMREKMYFFFSSPMSDLELVIHCNVRNVENVEISCVLITKLVFIIFNYIYFIERWFYFGEHQLCSTGSNIAEPIKHNSPSDNLIFFLSED